MVRYALYTLILNNFNVELWIEVKPFLNSIDIEQILKYEHE